MKKRISDALAALFFLALLIIGLASCADYGLPCDEPAEQIILQENMHEYAATFLGEDSDAARWYADRGIGRISQSIERDHGECAYYPFAALLPSLLDQPDRLTVAWHVYTWLWFMLGVLAVYGFCRETGLSRPLSAMGMLLLYLCPRFFAEGHYNNKDMVLLTLVLLTLWLGARFLKKPGFLRGALFSLAGAMATNTKIVGALGWGVIGLCAVALVTADRRWTPRMAGAAVSTVLIYIGVYALLTPAVWTEPIGYFRYLLENASDFSRWPGVVVFRGMVFEHSVNPLPRYYLPWMMTITLPLYVLPLAAAGQLRALRRVWRQKAPALRDPVSLSLAAASLCWFLPLLYAALARPLVYNGWRHFYFVYAGVVVLAAHGIKAFMDVGRRFGGEYGMHRLFAAGLCLFFLWTAGDISRNHPYQYGYYNRLAHDSAEAEMELDYWDVSTLNAMKRLLSVERDEELPLVLGARDDMSWFGVEKGYEVLGEEERALLSIAEERDAPYLFFNTTYARIYGVAPPQGYHELFAIESYGLRLCAVYELDRE